MTTRNDILKSLDLIELQLKNIKVSADNNGNFETTDYHAKLVEREDELMEQLGTFRI